MPVDIKLGGEKRNAWILNPIHFQFVIAQTGILKAVWKWVGIVLLTL